jgi:hypothetical protein
VPVLESDHDLLSFENSAERLKVVFSPADLAVIEVDMRNEEALKSYLREAVQGPSFEFGSNLILHLLRAGEICWKLKACSFLSRSLRYSLNKQINRILVLESHSFEHMAGGLTLLGPDEFLYCF